MFNVQICPKNHEIYTNYNEYLNEDEDDSIFILEHILNNNVDNELKSIIDLKNVKHLSDKELEKIIDIYDVLIRSNIKKINVISDNKSILNNIKNSLPDITITLLEIE